MVYDISYKILIGSKRFCITFYKIDRFIKIYDGTTYLTLFGSFWITCIFYHYFAKNKVDSYYSFPMEKTLNLHVIILIKSVHNKDKNRYYYKIFLEKCSYQLAKNNHKIYFHSIKCRDLERQKWQKKSFILQINLQKFGMLMLII